MIKKSEILKEAKKHLKKEWTVCCAINTSSNYDNYDLPEYSEIWDECDELKSWIMELLGDHVCYNHWLRSNHPEIFWKAIKKDPKLYKARSAWMDWMISYWEEQEEHYESVY